MNGPDVTMSDAADVNIEAPGVLSLPPAATPSSPLDDRRPPPSFDSHFGFYAAGQAQPQNQNQPLLQTQSRNPTNPFGDRAETASIASSTAIPSVLPPYHSAKYGIHKNEEDYLAALRAWAEEKQYVEVASNGGLPGFYGNEELKDRAERAKATRKAEKEVKARKREARRGPVAGVIPEEQAPGGRRQSISQFFGRRRQSNVV